MCKNKQKFLYWNIHMQYTNLIFTGNTWGPDLIQTSNKSQCVTELIMQPPVQPHTLLIKFITFLRMQLSETTKWNYCNISNSK